MAYETTYSVMPTDSYEEGRHILLEDARTLVETQVDFQDAISKFDSAIDAGKVNVYGFDGQEYIDKLDIGRLFHQNPEVTGNSYERFFSTEGEDVFKSAGPLKNFNLSLSDKTGKVIFSMPDAQFPESWDYNDALIVGNKYLYAPDKPELKSKLRDVIGSDHERSLVDLVDREVTFFKTEGKKLGYFKTDGDAEVFGDELAWLLMNRRGSFNSPTQFNAGLYAKYGITGSHNDINYISNPETGVAEEIRGEYERPQCHACFIEGPNDDLTSIVNHAVNEAGIFEHGSGVGQDIGKLRGEGETLSGGGDASGPLSFMKVYDTVAGTIKSGGKSRRAARMTSMRQHHPDVIKFINCKVKEEKKIYDLISLGYEGGMDGEAARTASFQNTNISVRLDKHFFDQLNSGGKIDLYAVHTGTKLGEIPADDMLKQIAFGAWRCGDPGVQYETPIQEMNTCSNSGPINSSNPCSEYMFLDHTSCNLASLNLIAFSDAQGNIDFEAMGRAIRIFTTAQDISNDAASYPVKAIAQISPEFRTIGLGYGNLGALLMRKGLAYGSEEGRNYAAAITAFMTGKAYEVSADNAENLGAFVHYELNKKPMANVINKHISSLEDINWDWLSEEDKLAVYTTWESARSGTERSGYRNAQVSLLAPTGTIQFLMGLDTSGVEPAYQLENWKNLAGGGGITMQIREIPNALNNLGYSEEEIVEILDHIKNYKGVLGAPHLNPDHISIFDTAAGDENGNRAISLEDHLRMMGAVQPFLSGAISKTCNLPEEATVKNLYDGIILGHELGLKAAAIFRDNSKATQVLGNLNLEKRLERGVKEELPNPRVGWEIEYQVQGQPFHLIVSEYEDGRPGQLVFLSYKAGSPMQALLASKGIDASTMLKFGVPVDKIIKMWRGDKFEPSGMVQGIQHIPMALSPLDAAAKALALHYKGDLSVAVEPEKVDITKLHGFENGAFETYRRMEVDDWNFEQVLKDPVLGGFVKSKTALPKKSKKHGETERGMPCEKCGNIMVQTKPGCFKCTHCGDGKGGCGI